MREVRLTFEGWTPRSVIQVAATLWKIAEEQKGLDLEAKTEIQETIHRIACGDRRMKRVWDELRKSHLCVQPDAWPLWLKVFGEMPEHGPHKLEDIGPALFFHKACLLVIVGCLFRAQQRRNVREADILRIQAQLLDAVEGAVPWSAVPGFADIKRVAELYDLDVPAMRRDRGNRAPHMYVNQLAATTRLLFDKTMHSTIATTANVALDLKGKREISRDDVRNWVSRD
jgi:hypothetical protein